MSYRELEGTKGPEWGSKSVRLTPMTAEPTTRVPVPILPSRPISELILFSKAVKPTEGSDLLSPPCLPLTRPTSSC